MADNYENMSRDELLVRVRDWCQIANDRSTEINRLRDALAEVYFHLGPPQDRVAEHTEVPGLVEEAMAERDQLRVISVAAQELTDAKIQGEAEREAEAWITLGGALAQLDSDMPLYQRILLDYAKDLETERSRLQAIIRKLVAAAHIEVEETTIDYAACEYSAENKLTDEERKAYRDAIGGT
jgi:hypothetical protein